MVIAETHYGVLRTHWGVCLTFNRGNSRFLVVDVIRHGILPGFHIFGRRWKKGKKKFSVPLRGRSYYNFQSGSANGSVGFSLSSLALETTNPGEPSSTCTMVKQPNAACRSPRGPWRLVVFSHPFRPIEEEEEGRVRPLAPR